MNSSIEQLVNLGIQTITGPLFVHNKSRDWEQQWQYHMLCSNHLRALKRYTQDMNVHMDFVCVSVCV